VRAAFDRPVQYRRALQQAAQCDYALMTAEMLLPRVAGFVTMIACGKL